MGIVNFQIVTAATGGLPTVSLSGKTIETLFDNTASTETALSVAGGDSTDWGRRVDVDLGRALVEADDNKDLFGRFEYTQNSTTRYFHFRINAGVFRSWTVFTTTSGTSGLPIGFEIVAAPRGRSGDDNLATLPLRGVLVYRRTSSGNDVVSFNMVPDGSNDIVAVSDMRGIVTLVPAIDALSVSVS